MLCKVLGSTWAHQGVDTIKSDTSCAFRWTHANFSAFHAIQIFTVIVKELM
jgi:hypothetical protein